MPSRRFGEAVGEAMRSRLADVRAARNVAELPLWVPDEAGSGRFSLPLGASHSLIFESNHASDREAEAGSRIYWDRVARVKLLEVKSNG
jgi:hypothetical protein